MAQVTFCCSFRETGWGHKIFHPQAFLGGLGYLPAQFLPVGADHVFYVGPDEVRKNGMSQVIVILPDEEQVKLSVQAVQAIVVGG